MKASLSRTMHPTTAGQQTVQSQAPRVDPKLNEGRRRLPLNIVANTSWFAVNAIVGLWYTPYLIGHLGVAVYGLVPLATSVVSYLSVLTTGLDSAVGRFLTIDLARGDDRSANQTFNTAIVGSLMVISLVIPAILSISWFAPAIFNIPSGYEQDAQWLVFLTMGAFLAATFANNFAISSYAYHRFDLRFLVNLLRVGAQMGSIIALFALLSPQVWQVGIGTLLSYLFFLLGHWVLWHRLTPHLSIKPGLFDRTRLKEMLGFSGWVLVNQVGALLFLSIDVIVANLIFGPEASGRYGSVVIFPTTLRALVATVNGVLVPMVMALYAQKNRSGLVRFSRLSVKFIGLMVALPIGLLCGLARPLLTVWLGPEFSDLSWLVIVLVVHLSISLPMMPLFSLQVATGKVRLPGIVSLLTGVGNLVLAVALARWSGWGVISIAVAGAIMLTIKNGFFTPLYGAHILKLPLWTFLPDLISGVAGCLLVGIAAYLVSLNWMLAGWGQLVLVGIVISVAYAGIAWLFGLNADERTLLKFEVERRFKRA